MVGLLQAKGFAIKELRSEKRLFRVSVSCQRMKSKARVLCTDGKTLEEVIPEESMEIIHK